MLKPCLWFLNAFDVFTDMFLKHPNVKDLRILRVYSKSIETKYYHGPHSSKVVMIIININSVDCIQF